MTVVSHDGNTWPTHSVQMPFAEMAGCVARTLKRLRDCFFLKSQSVAVRLNACPAMGSTRQDACSCRRTNRPSSMKSIESQTIGGHCVQVWRLQDGVIVVARLPPSLIVGHYQNDIWLLGADWFASKVFMSQQAVRTNNCYASKQRQSSRV